MCFIDVPDTPMGPLEVLNVTEKSVEIQWKPPETDGGAPLTSYIIEMRSASRSVWHKAGSVDSSACAFNVPDLKEGCEYYFRVMAVNAEGMSKPLENSDAVMAVKRICKCS